MAPQIYTLLIYVSQVSFWPCSFCKYLYRINQTSGRNYVMANEIYDNMVNTLRGMIQAVSALYLIEKMAFKLKL